MDYELLMMLAALVVCCPAHCNCVAVAVENDYQLQQLSHGVG